MLIHCECGSAKKHIGSSNLDVLGWDLQCGSSRVLSKDATDLNPRSLGATPAAKGLIQPTLQTV